MKRYILLILIIFGLISCYQGSLIEPGRSKSTFTVRVINKDDKPAKNAYVKINPWQQGNIEYDSTDANGEFSRELLEGEYTVEASIYEGLIFYKAVESFQIVGGLDKVRELRPYQYRGKLTLRVLNKDTIVIPNINLALLAYKREEGNYYRTFDECYNLIYAKGTTDSVGTYTFEDLPLYYYFQILVYRSKTDYGYGMNLIPTGYLDTTVNDVFFGY